MFAFCLDSQKKQRWGFLRGRDKDKIFKNQMLLFGLKFSVFEDLVPLPLKRRSLVTFSAGGESNIKKHSDKLQFTGYYFPPKP